jgi:5-methylcytosine-specific restriction endonuclease McrA
MAQEFAKSFYKSKSWQQCRASYIASVGGLCETCLEKNRVRPGKIVHHKTYLTPENINDPYITLNHAMLRYDCQDCHNIEHHGDTSVVQDGLAFDIYGNLIQVDSPH